MQRHTAGTLRCGITFCQTAVGGCSDAEFAAGSDIGRSTISFVFVLMQVPPLGLTDRSLQLQSQ